MFYIGSQKITPGLFSKGQSSGDEVTAINYTGTSISAGDKVWLNEKANVSASSTTMNFSSSNYNRLINRPGTDVFCSAQKYNINTQTIEGTNKYLNPRNHIVFTSAGGLYNDNYKITDFISELSFHRLDENYALNTRMTRDTYYLYRVNSNDNILKTWTISNLDYNSNGYYDGCVIGNILYLNYEEYLYTGQINENDSDISMTKQGYSDYRKHVWYTTSDNNLAIGLINGSYGTSHNEWQGTIQLFKINNDNSVTKWTSSNSDLNDLISRLNYITFNFNRNTGILCIGTSSYGIQENYYGMFKYENGDFTTIVLNLDNPPSSGYRALSVCDDMSKLVLGSILYTLQQTADGTYKALPYTYGIGNQSLTGVAKTSANQGESFTAMTILPQS